VYALFTLHIWLQHVTQAVRKSVQYGRKRGQDTERQNNISMRLLRILRYTRSTCIPLEYLENCDNRQPFRPECHCFTAFVMRTSHRYVSTCRRNAPNTGRRLALLLLYSEATIKVHNYTVVPVDFYGCLIIYRKLSRISFCISRTRPGGFWDPPSLLHSGYSYQVFFSGVQQPGSDTEHLPPLSGVPRDFFGVGGWFKFS
jgi:hypothetical protein